MKVRFLSPANDELDEAVRYYDHQLPGLGFRFFQEVAAGVDRIRSMPEDESAPEKIQKAGTLSRGGFRHPEPRHRRHDSNCSMLTKSLFEDYYYVCFEYNG